jgi:nitroreductase
MITNTVLDCIHARRSTRSFLDRPVNEDLLETLLDAAIWAPSGSNSQSWLFTAIANTRTLSEINELVKQGFQTYVPDDDYPSKHLAKTISQKEGYNFYYNAPVLIIASNKPNYENAMADCALGLENIFLAAQSLGLGSCYINQLHWLRDDGPLREYLSGLGIPKEHTICGAAAIGYIAKESAAPARKPGTTRIVH